VRFFSDSDETDYCFELCLIFVTKSNIHYLELMLTNLISIGTVFLAEVKFLKSIVRNILDIKLK